MSCAADIDQGTWTALETLLNRVAGQMEIMQGCCGPQMDYTPDAEEAQRLIRTLGMERQWD